MFKALIFVIGAIAIGRLVWIALAKQEAGDEDVADASPVQGVADPAGEEISS